MKTRRQFKGGVQAFNAAAEGEDGRKDQGAKEDWTQAKVHETTHFYQAVPDNAALFFFGPLSRVMNAADRVGARNSRSALCWSLPTLNLAELAFCVPLQRVAWVQLLSQL